MRTDTIFKVNNIDFSMYIPDGSYNISDVPVYKTWTDANSRDHQEVYRKRLQGSFDFIMNTMEDFNAFTAAYNAVKTPSGLTRVLIMNNSTNNLEEKDVYLSFTPVRKRHDDWSDYFERFTVTVKEW